MTHDGPQLAIDLSALQENYRRLKEAFSDRECAAVVKADAYGRGVEAVAPALAAIGCQRFFVATLEEGIQLRNILPDHTIAILHGVGPKEEAAFIQHRLTPVLNSTAQIERWHEAVKDTREARSILHLDTAMARLGLEQSEWTALAEQKEMIDACRIGLIMTHLACASEPDHPSNPEQLERFREALTCFPGLPASMVNSGGIFLGDDYHFDLARPGCALYGINPTHLLTPNPVTHVATLSAPILQIRTLEQDQAVGYGATKTLPKGSRLATLALGYADGILRHFSNHLSAYAGDVKLPLVGRVTMDMISVDVTDIPEGTLNEMDRIELINAQQDVNAVAGMAGTIGYELFSRLGKRVRRTYHGGDA